LPPKHLQELLHAGLVPIQTLVQGKHQQRIHPTQQIDGETALVLPSGHHGHPLLTDHQGVLTAEDRLQVPQVSARTQQRRDRSDQHIPKV